MHKKWKQQVAPNNFSFYKQMEFSKKRKGVTQVPKKYTREIPNQKKTKTKQISRKLDQF